MGTCEGCGHQLATKWKYCIHCGVANSAFSAEVTDPLTDLLGGVASEPHITGRSRVAAGAILFLLGITLLVALIIFLVETHR